MSIPKLKVYRLDTDFDESNDNDVQSQTRDELLPIAGKELNPLAAAEEMVGVKLRGDCRVVTRGAQETVEAGFDPENSMRTMMVPCEGWIMGKANIDVSVRDSAGTGWYVLDKRLWDYDVVEVKQYLVGGAYQDALDVSATEVHNVSHIVIRFGAMMQNTSIAKTNDAFDFLYDANNSANRWNSAGKTVMIHYYPYSETVSGLMPLFGSDSANPSTASAVFSDVYNGNLDGRTIHYANNSEPSVVLSGQSVPDNSSIVRTRMNRYEGNYLYRRRIFPLRVKSVPLSDGAGAVEATFNWYADGMMAPVFVEMVPVIQGGSSSSSSSDSSSSGHGPGTWVYKRLEEGVQFTKVYDVSGPRYTVTMNKSYYRLSGEQYCYPSEIYVFYNFTDDDLGEPFDFDFRYSSTSGAADTMPATAGYDIYGGYGRGNSGSFVDSTGSFDGSVRLRHEFLAVRESRGYDDDFGDVMLAAGGDPDTVQFTMPQSFTRNGVAGYLFDSSKGIRVYHNGILVGGTGSTPASSADGYYVGVSGSTVTVSHPSGTTVDDLMISCLVTSPSGNDIAGFRVPCYEKVKKTSLFVSSFPNWLKGHLNNDLDVFVGYQHYSGVNTADEQIDSVYPRYVKDGWHPMYPDGALQFTDAVEQYDYYDMFNFGVQSESVVVPSDKASQIWPEVGAKLFPNYCPTDGNLGNYRVYCNRVMCNVAHYEALYQVVRGRMSNISVQGGESRYKLLTDDTFSEAYGRRWTYRHDNYVRRMYSAGQEQLPRILDSSEDGHERPPSVTTESAERGTLIASDEPAILRANLSSDRVMFIRYVLAGNPVAQNGFIVCLNTSSAAYSKEVFSNLDDGDVRIHVKIEGGALNVGPETSQAPVANMDSATVFTQAVTWTPLPDRPDEVIPDIDADVDLDAVHDAGGDGNGVFYRYAYTGLPEFDVCFEPFSYHYTNAAAHEDRQVRSVEFMVYRTDKS